MADTDPKALDALARALQRAAHVRWTPPYRDMANAVLASLAAERFSLVPTATLDVLRAENERLIREDEQTLAERDVLEERLDELAYAIAPMGLIGEHSTGNDPWANALEIIQNAAPEHLTLVVGDTYVLAVLPAEQPATPETGGEA